MLSIAVAHFHFSIEQFHEFTPVEFDFALYQHRLVQEQQQTFYESQVRLINTFTFNSTPFIKKTIKNPKDLYELSFEQEIKDRVLSQKVKNIKPFISQSEFDNLVDLAARVN